MFSFLLGYDGFVFTLNVRKNSLAEAI